MKNVILALIFGFLSSAAFAQSNPVPTMITSNINNAPAWQAGHNYAVDQEVHTTGGSGLAGTRGYKVIACAATCTSAGNGGPSGTAPSIVDNQVTWKYLSDIDYTKISDWLDSFSHVQTAIKWTPNTVYHYGQLVVNNVGGVLSQFIVVSPGTGTSAASGPGPTGRLDSIPDGTLIWYGMPLASTGQIDSSAHGYIHDNIL